MSFGSLCKLLMAKRSICFKEIGHLSSSVSHPLVSFGQLLKNGWRINGSGVSPVLEHVEFGLSVAMTFKNESFIVQGYIRRFAQSECCQSCNPC